MCSRQHSATADPLAHSYQWKPLAHLAGVPTPPGPSKGTMTQLQSSSLPDSATFSFPTSASSSVCSKVRPWRTLALFGGLAVFCSSGTSIAQQADGLAAVSVQELPAAPVAALEPPRFAFVAPDAAWSVPAENTSSSVSAVSLPGGETQVLQAATPPGRGSANSSMPPAPRYAMNIGSNERAQVLRPGDKVVVGLHDLYSPLTLTGIVASAGLYAPGQRRAELRHGSRGFRSAAGRSGASRCIAGFVDQRGVCAAAASGSSLLRLGLGDRVSSSGCVCGDSHHRQPHGWWTQDPQWRAFAGLRRNGGGELGVLPADQSELQGTRLQDSAARSGAQPSATW